MIIETLLKVGSATILGVGTVIGVAASFGALKTDYSNVKDRLTHMEAIQQTMTKQINRIDGNIEFLRGRFDKNYEPKHLEGE